jgi:hypothetical protein
MAKENVLEFPLLYGGVSLPREHWKRVHIMFWSLNVNEDK